MGEFVLTSGEPISCGKSAVSSAYHPSLQKKKKKAGVGCNWNEMIGIPGPKRKVNLQKARTGTPGTHLNSAAGPGTGVLTRQTPIHGQAPMCVFR